MTGGGTWAAGLPFSTGTSLAGRLCLVGGTLTLTAGEVTFRPLGGLGRVRRFALADIESVTAYATKPPRLRIAPRGGKPVVFMVLPDRSTSVWSTDTSARDDALAAINARLTGR